jgi:protein-disulfide isomerase
MRDEGVVLALLIAATTAIGCRDSAEPENTLALPGIDTSSLVPREKHELDALVKELYAPCADVAVSVAQCLTEKRPCSRCAIAAKFIYDRVHDGQSREQIEEAYKARFDPSAAKSIPLDGSPSKGPAAAPVTIVEFADFECQHCKNLEAVLGEVLASHPNDVRLVFKFYPLVQIHHYAEPAARAAIAAMAQGKFWQMHDLLFANQEHLGEESIRTYAKEVGLDVPKLEADMTAQAATDRIAKDGVLVRDLAVDHTPTVYVNGRYVDHPQTELEDWVQQELGVTK